MKKLLFWFLSFIITLAFAVFQRATGPTHPVKSSIKLENGQAVSFRLPRSCTIGAADCLPSVTSKSQISGRLMWRRHNIDEIWVVAPMEFKNGVLSYLLPDQPPAGKVEYYAFINQPAGDLELSAKPLVARFKGPVPSFILVPHIVFMFLFMLFSVRIFITVFTGYDLIKHAVCLNLIFLIAGGFIFGPLTQYYAFGAYWTGWPYGHDLTDNKTLILFFAWLPAVYAVFKMQKPRAWLAAAFAVTALVYLVPHSLFGSELNYSDGTVVTGYK